MFNQILKISYSYIKHTKFCVLGGGTGGINTVSQLLRQNNIRAADIRIFEPSSYHYYQPGWTMVGNNLADP
jgi:sulfide:quinone oxidoreductase